MNVRMPGTLKAARVIMAVYCVLGVLATGLGVVALLFAADLSENLQEDPAAQEMLTAEELEQLSAQNPTVNLVLGIVVLAVFLAATFRLGRGGGTAQLLVRLAAAASLLSALVTFTVGGGFGLGVVLSAGLAVLLLALNEVRASREWFAQTGQTGRTEVRP
ncbi:hypothetical protein NE857_27955 [Nocardiopsis exhalans]|uniref:Integral membrane protein n=1 Tax=Nocardiopsis exhalans TaxID=163604 RepID=A0ABY5D3W3_9ACTN|nr:hypothetical protein [Nocardiopsis exhalans]USY19066.1 hypothetical protein NE857_27955 [Nocardiopsis exhalans]